MAEPYFSSEELQRHYRDVAAKEKQEAEGTPATEGLRLKKMLDKYINLHNSTVGVRSEAKKKNRENGYQLDLSADLVEILEKIKKEVK